MTSINDHYEGLASTYDALWSQSQAAVDAMTGLIVQHLRVEPGHSVVDIGGGTGLFAKALLDRTELLSPIKVVDPSPSMLTQLHEDSRIESIVGDADSFADRGERVDRILIKEAVHHFPNPSQSLKRLAGCLNQAGRLLIVMLPRRLEYPLFDAALEKFARLQPDHRELAGALSDAQLDVDVSFHAFSQTYSTQRYIEMVESRYMSLLSEFSDEELAAGIDEMRRKLTSDTVLFADNFVFITGVQNTF
ncbi:MAG: class I SAM-dependent methyltransferase [Pseudomonadota bacterium]